MTWTDEAGTYTTQMDAARKGICTRELEAVAKKEGIEPEELRKLVAQGRAVIPCNKVHTCIEPHGIGSRLRTKINVNLGVSRDCKDLDMEMEKVRSAVDLGAESIMDLSSFGDTRRFRTRLTKECPAIIGTVPIYDAVVYYHKALKDITAQEWLDIVKMHAEDIAKGIPGAREQDDAMSLARKQLDWEKQFALCLDPEKARRYWAEAKPEREDTCSMCGNFCAVRNMNRILDGEIVSIFNE